MRLRPLLVLGTAALLLLTACAPEPTPSPTPTRSPSATPTPTPTPEPIVEPDAAFAVTCDDVAAEMAGLVGEPSTPVNPALSIVSGPGWLPGPAQYMFQRAAGIACSAGDTTRNWEVSIAPGAESIVAGATERGGYWGEVGWCDAGTCMFEFPDGGVFVSASIRDSVIGAGDTERVREALRRLAASAAASIREVAYVDSDIVGMPCEHFITEEGVRDVAGEDVTLSTKFEGWGIPAEIYEVVNGSRICFFMSTEGDMGTARSYLMVTSLPAGAWAFEKQVGTAVDIEGADAALASEGQHGQRYLDLRIGLDWIRLMTFDNGSGAADPAAYAATVVRSLTTGVTAPE
ncbi:hypothetical protein [Microbacterium sp. NPDC089696]|uniref:hypothetical protein n=1 Tax=Microbacterium sp. NPDC089696 TaxID=3364199 RepID=UPI00380D3E09